MASKKMWVFAGTKQSKAKLDDLMKYSIKSECQPLVEDFKRQYIKENPDKSNNYVVDIYTKWNRNYLYFCQKFKSEHPNRTKDEFEDKFVRLEFLAKDTFNISYFRHTGQWSLVDTNITLKECLEMIQNIPTFQPIS
jgi:RNase P subunit RPR2